MPRMLGHERAIEARRAERATPHASWLIALVLVLIGGTGCNIVQGFQQAGDTLFPDQSTYLAAPGLRLVSGGYRDLSLVVGADLYLLAHGTDATTGDLFAMRYADPQPCTIANVGAYTPTRDADRKLPLVSYFHENSDGGTLHFVDMNCKVYDLEFANARFPVAETATSLVVWAGSDLWLATPETGTQVHLAANVQDLIGGVPGKGFVIRADGHLELFSSEWRDLGSYGDQITSVRQAGKSLFYQDSGGMHRLVAAPDETLGLSDTLLASDACALGMQDQTWVTFRSPCSGGSVIAVHEPTGHQFTLAFAADPEQLKLLPARQSAGLDPNRDPFWFFTLRDGDAPDSTDTLVVKTPTGTELVLGAHGTLLQLQLLESAAESHGYALVNVAGNTGQYLWWNDQGQTKVLAEQAFIGTSRVLSDFDGALGTLGITSGDRLLSLAEGVPWQSFEYRDDSQPWTVLFHDLHGQNGELSAFYGSLDTVQATPIGQPFRAPELASIAPSVGVFRTSNLKKVLSGVMYLADYDSNAGTGRLDYRNMELRFTASVNQGVSDYISSDDQVLYAIPFGNDAGIWIVSGK